ncbi:hypothetical protein FB451DRAFT_1032869 [Mycena latifolia]|nr:hypothetical protein FB451DRAFT_1032869 [Mycena latifolia]
MTGHNGFCPCRSCEIKGTRNVTGGDTIYYVPLTKPLVDGQPKRSWDPRKLPLRTHESFAEVTAKLAKCKNATARKKVKKHHGIKGLPALRRVRSLVYGKSSAWELMHLGFENTAPNMYYTHACQFSKIIKHCIGFEITYDQIDRLEDDIIDWVQKYEEYYYQYDESRLSACPLTIHAWLHVADDIRFCGPSWATWTFWVERYCGYLQQGLNSRWFPWANLNNRILRTVYLEQLGARYDLEDELSTRRVYDKSALSRSERAYDEVMPRWGKVRIVDGDSIRSTSACAGESSDVTERDMSFARYELQVKAHDDTWITRVFYGRLEEILVCELLDDPLWLDMAATTRLLAVITPCSTSGKDAAQESTFYTQMSTPIVTDIRTIIAVVGRIKTRAEWMIIDRSGSPIHPEFVPQDL